jgi:hypothetical protein
MIDMMPPGAAPAQPQGPRKFNPATLLGKTFKIPGLEGSVSFTVVDLAPNAKGKMDAWFKANETKGGISADLSYTGDHLRENGFEIPEWEFNNVRDQELQRLGGQVNREERGASGLTNVEQFQDSSPVAEALVEKMLDGDDDTEPKGARKIDWNERLKKLRARRGE